MRFVEIVSLKHYGVYCNLNAASSRKSVLLLSFVVKRCKDVVYQMLETRFAEQHEYLRA